MTKGFCCWACGSVAVIVTSFYDVVLKVRGRRCRNCAAKGRAFDVAHIGKQTDYEISLDAKEPDEYDFVMIEG